MRSRPSSRAPGKRWCDSERSSPAPPSPMRASSLSGECMARRRVAILISGRGSNMAALIAAARDPAYPAEIALVLSNRPGAAGLDTARKAGLATAVVDHSAFGKDREGFE